VSISETTLDLVHLSAKTNGRIFSDLNEETKAVKAMNFFTSQKGQSYSPVSGDSDSEEEDDSNDFVKQHMKNQKVSFSIGLVLSQPPRYLT
jgi:hypothetical protein